MSEDTRLADIPGNLPILPRSTGGEIAAAERDCNLRMAMVMLDPETPDAVLRHMRVELVGIGEEWLREHPPREQSSFEESFRRYLRAMTRKSDLMTMRERAARA